MGSYHGFLIPIDIQELSINKLILLFDIISDNTKYIKNVLRHLIISDCRKNNTKKKESPKLLYLFNLLLCDFLLMS